MKRNLLSLLFLTLCLTVFSQKIETDIFNDLKYKSQNKEYESQLKKDIFGNLTFTDSKKNQIIFKKEYLVYQYGDRMEHLDQKIDFFKDLIHQMKYKSGFEAKYAIDIFNKITIEDNQNYKLEYGGNPVYSETTNGNTTSISKDLTGAFHYKCNNEEASLRMDIFHKWVYEDNEGNKFEFGVNTWSLLIKRYGNEEGVLLFLANQYLFN